MMTVILIMGAMGFLLTYSFLVTLENVRLSKPDKPCYDEGKGDEK